MRPTATADPRSARAHDGESVPWDRRSILALVSFVAVCLVSLFWLVHPFYEVSDETNDASIYILCTKSMLAGQGYSYMGMPFILRPPGFSCMLAPLIAWRGLDFRTLNLFVSSFGIAGCALLFVHARPRLGTLLSLCLAAAVWLAPGYQRLCNQVMSDVPGAAWMLAALLVERWASREESPIRDVILGTVIGLAGYVRSGNLLLAPAILLSRALEHGLSTSKSRGRDPSEPRNWIRFVLVRMVPLGAALLLVILPWSVRNAIHHPPTPVDQNFHYSYSTSMWHVDPSDPSSALHSLPEILARVPARAPQLLSALGRWLLPGGPDLLHRILGASMIAGALVVLLVRRRASEFLLFAWLASLLVWVTNRDRLVLPVYLLTLPAALEAASWGLRSVVSERAVRVSISLGVVLLVAIDFRPRKDWDKIEANHRAFTELAAAVDGRLPADARIAALVGWHYSVYLDRPVYSLSFAMQRKGLQGAEEVIDKYGIDTVLLSRFISSDRSMMAAFVERYGNPVQGGQGVLLRVRR